MAKGACASSVREHVAQTLLSYAVLADVQAADRERGGVPSPTSQLRALTGMEEGGRVDASKRRERADGVRGGGRASPSSGDRYLGIVIWGSLSGDRYLGIVADVCREIGVAEWLNAQDPTSRQQVRVGTATVAMVLNGVGFSNRHLYVVPQFFADKPVEHLLGSGDHGRCR